MKENKTVNMNIHKYTEIAKVMFKSQIIYRFDVIMTTLATIGRVLFAYILWNIIFTDREHVGGFSYNGMLFYYIVTSFLASLDISNMISKEIAEQVRNGTFSKYMIIPAHPLSNFMARNLGTVGYYAIFSGFATVFSIFAFQIKPHMTSDIPALLSAIIMIPIGLTFMVAFHFFIGILTIKLQDITILWHILETLILFATGTILPLSLLPDTMTDILHYLPFTYVTYTPAMLILGKAGWQEGVAGLATITFWLIFMVIASHTAYQHLRTKYDGVGI